ncbi:MAG: twin-arginine translocase subunit TatC [Syntrophomonadaceae bacterium]
MDITDFFNTDKSQPGEMSFMDHLEELRWRIIYSLIGVIAGTILCWVFSDFLITKILLAPATRAGIKLQNLRPFGQIMLYFEISIIGGIILSLPNLVYQLWKFIEPALRVSEKKYISAIVLFTTFCFLSGIAFAYFVMLPMTFGFAANFGSKAIENNFAVDEYLSIIVSIMLGAGVVFELPMLSFFLSKLGILKPQLMRRYRRHAIVVIMILAAFLTPGTDPVSQLVLAVPLVLLYEISIFVSKMSQRKS